MQMAYFHWGLLNLPKYKLHRNRKKWDKACTSLPPNYYSSAAAVSYAYTSERWQCFECQSNNRKAFFLAVVWNKEFIQSIVKNILMKNLLPRNCSSWGHWNFCRSWQLVSWVTTGKAAAGFILFPTLTFLSPGNVHHSSGTSVFAVPAALHQIAFVHSTFSRSWKALLACSGKNLQ